MVILNIKIDIVYLENANIGLICKNFYSDSHFLRFKKAKKAHNRRYFFLHIAFFTQNTKTLIIVKTGSMIMDFCWVKKV